MRLGGPVFEVFSPEEWAAAHRAAGYRAAYWPNVPETDERAFLQAAQAADLVIAEVGAWSNPLSPDDAKRREAVALCQERLAVADRVGARCCVNIAGSRGEKWDGPCADDLTEDTFALIVDSVREIIDAVRPRRSFYTLETMPWMYPDSVESYRRLVDAIDRPAFAVHFDPANLINCPRRFFNNGALITQFVEALGPLIRSCHAKDVRLADEFTVHLSEAAPGEGGLDYPTLLRALSGLDADLPVMLEHLPAEKYPAAAHHLREVAAAQGLTL